ncbi:MAG: hypothetical protein QOD77_4 [Thermoplasmata archaeon]|jgi:hypothetical protein|nr:hypothetical protein [Thermoplasmata archaeon]
MEGQQGTEATPAASAAATVAGTPPAIARTVLELIATVMDASFEALGEGVMLGTMPAYLERFGAKNARHIRRHYVETDATRGAVSALAPLNFVSALTSTPFTMAEAGPEQATKRLHACEFAAAFQHKTPFGRAMICQLHRAVYQGSVNGLLQPGQPGYQVQLRSRILFGDRSCDFLVTSDAPRDQATDPGGQVLATPTPEQREADSLHFYMAILVAFVDYLTEVMPPEAAHRLLDDCASKVGVKLAPMFPADSPYKLARSILEAGGRTVEASPLPVLRVTACPFAGPIRAIAKHGDEAAVRERRLNACRLCHGVLRGAVATQGLMGVERASCLTVGDADCRFRIVPVVPGVRA